MGKSNDSFDFEIIDASSMAFVHKRIVFDKSGFVHDFIILHANRAFKKLMNVKSADIYGMEESNFFGYAKENYQKLLKEYTGFFKEKKPFFIDIYSPRFQKWLRIKYEHIRDDYYISWIIDVNAEKIIMQTSNEIFQSGNIGLEKIVERAFRISESSLVYFCRFREDTASLAEYDCFFENESLTTFSETITELFLRTSKETLIKSFTKTHSFQIGNSTFQIDHPDAYDFKIHLLNRKDSIKGFFLFLFEKEKEIENLLFLLTYMEQISMLMLKTELEEKRITAEKNLLDKERNYRIMTENTTDGVAMIKDKQLQYVSPSYLKMLNLTDDRDLIHLEDAMLNVPNEYKNQIRRSYKKAISEKRKTLTHRYPVMHKDGSRIWVEDNIKISWDEESNSQIVYINGRDVTKQVQFENELRETKMREEKANAVKTEFMMNMSHELRTPLNGILGFSHILKATELSGEQVEYVQNIEISGKRLLGVVNDILDFTKIQTYKMKVLHEPVNIRELMINLMNVISENAKKKGLKAELQIDEDIPECLITDKMKLTQVIGNLMMNALKFTEKGKILLKAQLFTKNSLKAIIKFSVIDTGIGIDDSMKKLIFDSFTQADSSITRRYGGTGLGLSIANGILNLMNSRLNLISNLGEGSEFSFIVTFEVSDSKRKVEKVLVCEENISPERNMFKILIVEDNVINLKLNKTIIKRYYPDANIVEAVNGKEAVEKHLKQRFDVILMDIRMPEMNGLEATKVIRENLEDNETVIIGLSAEAHKDKINEGISAGMDDYITKPVIPKELTKSINKYI